MKKNIIYIILVLLLIGVIAFLTFGKDLVKPNYMVIKGKEAKTLVKNGAIVLDVRSNEEYKKKHIKGAINLPSVYVKKINFKSEKPIIVYCSRAKDCRDSANKLIEKGFTNVYSLGSMDNWTGDVE